MSSRLLLSPKLNPTLSPHTQTLRPPFTCRFYKLGTADEAVGLEGTVEPWVEGLYPALAKVRASQTAPCQTKKLHINHNFIP